MLLLVSCQNVHFHAMRNEFFSGVPLETTLEVYRFSKGKVIGHTIIDHSIEIDQTTQYSGFFHTAANGDVFLLWSKGTNVPENPRQTGIYLQPTYALEKEPVKLTDDQGWLFGSKVRLGAAPCDIVDLYWPRSCEEIMYARIDLNDYR